MLDNNKNNVSDKTEWIIVTIAGFICYSAAIYSLLRGVIETTGIVSLFAMGSALLGGKAVKNYLKK